MQTGIKGVCGCETEGGGGERNRRCPGQVWGAGLWIRLFLCLHRLRPDRTMRGVLLVLRWVLVCADRGEANCGRREGLVGSSVRVGLRGAFARVCVCVCVCVYTYSMIWCLHILTL